MGKAGMVIESGLLRTSVPPSAVPGIKAKALHPPSPHNKKQKATQCVAFASQQLAAANYFISLASALPRSAGDFTVVTPAFSSAANLASAVPLPPEMIAPA